MYKINYTKLAIMEDGSTGNISQGKGTAYMVCPISDIENKLIKDLAHTANEKKYYPLIITISAIDGHMVS